MGSRGRAVLGVALAGLVGACGRTETGERAAGAGTPAVGVQAPGCGVTDSTVVTEAGIGALVIGRALREVETDCRVLRDTTVLGVEGMPARVATVDLGRDTVAVELVDGELYRITLDRPAFRTRDSLGVGTRLPVLLRYPGAHGAVGEGDLFVLIPSHCGLSFEVPVEPSRMRGGAWTEEKLRTLPDTTSVTRVLVFGCQEQEAGG